MLQKDTFSYKLATNYYNEMSENNPYLTMISGFGNLTL